MAVYIGAYFTEGKVPKTGLSPTINGYRVSDNALIVDAQAMSEVGEGLYKYELYSSIQEALANGDAVFICDGGSITLDEQYVSAGLDIGNYEYLFDIQQRLLGTLNANLVSIEGNDISAARLPVNVLQINYQNTDGYNAVLKLKGIDVYGGAVFPQSPIDAVRLIGGSGKSGLYIGDMSNNAVTLVSTAGGEFNVHNALLNMILRGEEVKANVIGYGDPSVVRYNIINTFIWEILDPPNKVAITNYPNCDLTGSPAFILDQNNGFIRKKTSVIGSGEDYVLLDCDIIQEYLDNICALFIFPENAINSQQVRDALKLAPSVGDPDAGSIDLLINSILEDTETTLPNDITTSEGNIRGTDSDTLKTISDQLDIAQADLDDPNQYKADVSLLSLETTSQDIKTKTDTLPVDISLLALETTSQDIKLKTDTLPVDISNLALEANVESHVTNALNSYDPPTRTELTDDKDEILLAINSVAGISTDDIKNMILEGDLSFIEFMRIILASLAGETSKDIINKIIYFKSLDGLTNRITCNYVGKNRITVTLDGN